MPDDYKPITNWNAVAYLHNFILKYLVLTPEEETILEHISLSAVNKIVITETPQVINIPANIRAINKQLKKKGLKMCNYCGKTKPVEEFYRRFGLCSACCSYLKKKRRDNKNEIHDN